jgi:hypothetical protein
MSVSIRNIEKYFNDFPQQRKFVGNSNMATIEKEAKDNSGIISGGTIEQCFGPVLSGIFFQVVQSDEAHIIMWEDDIAEFQKNIK